MDRLLDAAEVAAMLAEELWDHRRWSCFDGDDDLVFPNPRTGRPFDPNRLSTLMRAARQHAGITGYVRPSHDLRHTSITNQARAGASEMALMARGGHTSFSTSQRYIQHAGARFLGEGEGLEERLFGSSGTRAGTKTVPCRPYRRPGGRQTA